MKKEIKEKIIEILEDSRSSLDRDWCANQISELFSQREKEIYDWCFKKCGEDCGEAIKKREKEVLEEIKKIPTMNGGQKNWKNYLLEKLKELKKIWGGKIQDNKAKPELK